MNKTNGLKSSKNPHTTLRTNLRCSLIIALCFLWTSAGYLSWLYNLSDFTEPSNVDWLTEVIGYVFQAIGLLLFMVLIKRSRSFFSRKSVFIACIAADFAFIILSVLSKNFLLILIFGYLMNLFHGIIAGFYLTLLSKTVEAKYRSIVFGGAYAASSVFSWLLSLLNNSNFLRSEYALISYGIFASITIGIVLTQKDFLSPEKQNFTEKSIPKGTFALAALTVFFVSVTRGIGFFFPMADISSGISLELSRAFYAVGLIAAGIIGDRSRKYGAISCLAALFFPFAMIALSNEVGISIVIWSLGYLFFGFLAVFRVVVFSDIAAANEKLLYVAGFGLMFGRMGDAAGNFTGIMLNDNLIALVIISSVCFIAAFVFFFALYNKLFFSKSGQQANTEERLAEFIRKYELSSRETEVLRLITKGASNSDISTQLFISENTVKFHVRNILKKTGCTNRSELLAEMKKP